jgi:hypothetical protein
MLAHFIDARFVRAAARALDASKDERLRFVVNGHTHFATLAPLGTIGGGPACYFNSGTWRRLHRLGGLVGGGPAFISHETMTFLLFYPKPDGTGRRWEQWTGALGETA